MEKKPFDVVKVSRKVTALSRLSGEGLAQGNGSLTALW
jgi:hypothetical protein